MLGSETAYVLYVEKELVGKRIKSTKVKVTWKFACEPDLVTHEVALKHSLVSSKHEIKLDGNLILDSKKGSSKSFYHTFYASKKASPTNARSKLENDRLNFNENNYQSSSYPRHGLSNPYDFRFPEEIERIELGIKVEEGFEGYTYDLVINGKLFHQHKRMSIMQLEEIRKQRRQSVFSKKQHSSPSMTQGLNNDDKVKSLSYASFTKRHSETLDAHSSTSPGKPARKESEESVDLLGMGTDHNDTKASPSSYNKNEKVDSVLPSYPVVVEATPITNKEDFLKNLSSMNFHSFHTAAAVDVAPVIEKPAITKTPNTYDFDLLGDIYVSNAEYKTEGSANSMVDADGNARELPMKTVERSSSFNFTYPAADTSNTKANSRQTPVKISADKPPETGASSDPFADLLGFTSNSPTFR